MFPIYCNSVLNSWHFFRDIFRPFLSRTFSKSSNCDMWAFFEGVRSKRLFIIALWCILFCRHSKIAFIYDCQIEGEMFNPIVILWYIYDALPKYGNILQYPFDSSKRLNEWNASFRSSTERTSHLELPKTENVCLTNR